MTKKYVHYATVARGEKTYKVLVPEKEKKKNKETKAAFMRRVGLYTVDFPGLV